MVHSLDTGKQIMNTFEEFDCDHLESCDDYILTRCEDGKSIFICRYYQNREDLEIQDQIDLSKVKEESGIVTDFKMKGNIVTRFQQVGGPNFDIVLMVSVTQDSIMVNALKHKPLSEM